MKEAEPLRLNEGALSRLRERLAVPAYDRARTVGRIAHVGVGGFHRAHMALYTDELLNSGESDWAIHGIGLTGRDKQMAETMADQDGLYTVVTRSPTEEAARVCGSISSYFHYPDGAGELATRIAREDYRIISLTVTESGYRYRGDERDLDLEDPDVAADLRNPENPRSVVGFLFEIARQRVRAGRQLPTFLSCDNIPHNGSALRKLLLQFAHEVDQELERAISRDGAFPNSMVDRITPVTTDADRAYIAERWGVADRWPVVCEDFRQWFIEDSFSAGRPPWDQAGARFVSDVTAYERMKIRLLNGAHSALAYLSYLLGYRLVDEAVNDSDVSAFVRGYMGEVAPTVGSVPGIDLNRYQESLLERFSNSAIADTVLRLAEDGSRKIPNMVLPAVSQLLDSGSPAPYCAFAVAAWIRFLHGTDEQGAAIPIHDPGGEALQAPARRCSDGVGPFVEETKIFPEDVRSSSPFVEELQSAYLGIRNEGVRASLKRLLGE